MSERDSIERAVAALRGGRPVRIGSHSPITVLAVETSTAEMLALADPDAIAPVLISGHRAAALSLTNQRNAADPDEPVLLARSDWLDPETVRQLVDPARDFDRAPFGPIETVPLGSPDQASAALMLARLAGLLPALWIVNADASVTVEESDLAAAPQSEMTAVARAHLPIEDIPETQMHAFRSSVDGSEHVALVIGAFGGQPPLVRLHSECLTGDVFGSLKCDCGLQLKKALRIIAGAGGGILLYLRQEGRGIGLVNKLRAYALQDLGLDTVEANRRLGFSDDERNYADAAGILRSLKVDSVRLLTNNPAKVVGLEAAGISVAERISHHMPVNPHNADYLATKRRRSGHLD